MEQTIQNIPLLKIWPSPLNPRKTFDRAGIEELAESIRLQGLLQPITVRPSYTDVLDGATSEVLSTVTSYEIVCGERRYRALALIGSETVPCIVREMTDEEAFDAMITENLQRKDVDPIEEAFAFAQLYERGKSVEEIAARFGKSLKFIRERIKLYDLLPEMKQWVSKGLMQIGAAIHVAKLTEEDQNKFLEQFDPGEDEDMEDLDPITKSDAEEFTDNLFKRISSAEWDKDFTGSCQYTCDRCPFNSANEGCLFNDLKVKQDDACCTNRVRWNAKRMDWWKHIIDEQSDKLVKKGEVPTLGNVVLAHSDNYYGNADTTKELKQYCIDQGYLLVDVASYFERWQNLKLDAEDTQKKLANGDAMMVLLIDYDYRGARVEMKCFPLRKAEENEKGNAETAKVAQLVRDYNTNIEKNKGEIANEMRHAVADFDLNTISWKALTAVEWEIFLTLLINSSPFNVRNDIIGRANGEAEYAKDHNTAEGREDIIRKWLRGKLSDSGVQYYPTHQKCQARLIEVWGIDDGEVRGRAAAKLRKKNEKIEKELTKLGYDSEGKKLEF